MGIPLFFEIWVYSWYLVLMGGIREDRSKSVVRVSKRIVWKCSKANIISLLQAFFFQEYVKFSRSTWRSWIQTRHRSLTMCKICLNLSTVWRICHAWSGRTHWKLMRHIIRIGSKNKFIPCCGDKLPSDPMFWNVLAAPLNGRLLPWFYDMASVRIFCPFPFPFSCMHETFRLLLYAVVMLVL